jgi:uncharacterized protein (TIGR03435 family)
MRRCLLSALIFMVTFASPGLGQSVNPPAFEVADIKPGDPAIPYPGKGRILPGGRIELPGMTVQNLIVYGYGVQERMIVGGPKWTDSDRFDIVAKAPPDTPMATMRLMIQNLLAERFKLAIHREDKLSPAYVLTLGKRELKLHEGNGGRQDCSWSMLEGGLRKRTCHNLSMTEFAAMLPGWGGIGIDLPVIDQTGLKGAYDFELEVGIMMGGAGMGRPEGGGRGGDAPAQMTDSGPTIFNALDKVGLKLESRKMPVPAVVIDKVERPTDN